MKPLLPREPAHTLCREELVHSFIALAGRMPGMTLFIGNELRNSRDYNNIPLVADVWESTLHIRAMLGIQACGQ